MYSSQVAKPGKTDVEGEVPRMSAAECLLKQ